MATKGLITDLREISIVVSSRQRLRGLLPLDRSTAVTFRPALARVRPMTADDIRDLHDQFAGFDDIEWIDDATRDIVERFMPDLASRLPEKRTETFDQAFGRVSSGRRGIRFGGTRSIAINPPRDLHWKCKSPSLFS